MPDVPAPARGPGGTDTPTRAVGVGGVLRDAERETPISEFLIYTQR